MKYIFQILIGLGLIASGVFHEFSMGIFEVRLYELFGLDWYIIPFFGRIWAAMEMYLGISLILRINPKKVHFYMMSFLFLFVLYDSVWDAFFNSNAYYLEIWPFFKYIGTSFVYFKLVFAVILGAHLYMEFRSGKSTDFKWKWIKFLFPVGALAFTFINNAVFPRDLNLSEPEKKTELTVKEINDSMEVGQELASTEGDQILMFISLGCSHCFAATKKIAAIKRKNPDLDVRLILFKDNIIDEFHEYAHSEEIPHSVVSGKTFIEVTNGAVPRILHVKDGEIIRQWDGKTFNYAALSYMQNLK